MTEALAVAQPDAQAGADQEMIKLHIGGIEPKAGWTIVNIADGPNVDVVGSAVDLSMFANGSVTTVYASHILEHLSHRIEMLQALKEFARVLKPGGELLASVPDLEVLCRLYTMPGINEEQRFLVMRMIYGGQIDDYDFHKTGFNFGLMAHALQEAGFKSCMRVERHGLFNDTSNSVVFGAPISLNIRAVR